MTRSAETTRRLIAALALAFSATACSAAPVAPGAEKAGATSTCPCSGSTLCVGPRGGRYCITSGGNKRYIK